MTIKPIAPLSRMPRSRAEWINASNLAYTLLCIDSARQYGLIEGGPQVNVEQCELIVERAKMRGIKPLFDHRLIEELTA